MHHAWRRQVRGAESRSVFPSIFPSLADQPVFSPRKQALLSVSQFIPSILFIIYNIIGHRHSCWHLHRPTQYCRSLVGFKFSSAPSRSRFVQALRSNYCIHWPQRNSTIVQKNYCELHCKITDTVRRETRLTFFVFTKETNPLYCTSLIFNRYPSVSVDPPFKLTHGSGNANNVTHDPANSEQQPNRPTGTAMSAQSNSIAPSTYCSVNTS